MKYKKKRWVVKCIQIYIMYLYIPSRMKDWNYLLKDTSIIDYLSRRDRYF